MADIRRSAIAIGIIAGMCILPVISLATIYSRSSFYFRSKCSDIYTQAPCETASCYWWDDSCHPYQQYLYNAGRYCLYIDDDVIFCITDDNSNYVIIEGVVVNV